jgi:hypothetical protein
VQRAAAERRLRRRARRGRAARLELQLRPGIVDVCAPGPGGTSFAAPRVSAPATALFWRQPGWSVGQVRAALVAGP